MRTCSNRARCISKAYSLTTDNFRKASSGSQFFNTCNHCWNRLLCLLIGQNPCPSLCSFCQVKRSSQDFLDSNGIVFFLIYTECKATWWPPVGFVKSTFTLSIGPRLLNPHRQSAIDTQLLYLLYYHNKWIICSSNSSLIDRPSSNDVIHGTKYLNLIRN